jgi:hypothetical protein
MGHALGIKDEYVEGRATNRSTATAPGVFHDNSIMGDFYTEGIDTAEAKTRHAAVMAGHIGAATTRTLTASRPVVEVTVLETEDWRTDEVYVRVRGPGGTTRTAAVDLRAGQSHTFPVSLVPFGDLSKPVIVDVFDEDWPDADDLIVSMWWNPPFPPSRNRHSYDGANYKVEAKLGGA